MSTIKYTLAAFLFLSVSLLYAQPVTWNSSTSYLTGALVIVGTSTYVATKDVPANNTPPNTTYWKSLKETAATLSMTTAALEALPTTAVSDLLATLPGAAPDSSSSDGGSSSSSKFLGISTRGLVSSSISMYGSIVITGTSNKTVAFMGKGQTMSSQGVTNYVADPRLEIYKLTNGSWVLYKSNDNWGDTSSAESISTVSGNTGITLPVSSMESAIVLNLEPGNYSAILKSNSAAVQEALVEAYEISSLNEISRFLGISTRCGVSSSNTVYGSIAITGTENKTVAFMGKGETMSSQGVSNYVTDPRLDIYKLTNGSWALYKSNDNWGDASSAESISTVSGKVGITLPVSATEAAIVLSLEPGNYSAMLKSNSNSVQEAIVEAYEVD